jgi:hypothetical protein
MKTKFFEDDAVDEDGLWWPSAAKPQLPADFGKFFSCPSSSALCYTFVGRVRQGVGERGSALQWEVVEEA